MVDWSILNVESDSNSEIFGICCQISMLYIITKCPWTICVLYIYKRQRAEVMHGLIQKKKKNLHAI